MDLDQHCPNVTYGGGCVRFILSFTQPVFDTRQVQRLVQQLQSGRLAPNPQNLGCWSLKSGLREGQRLAYARTAPRNKGCANPARYQRRQRSCFWAGFK